MLSTQRAAAGARMLDAAMPGWHNRIDTGTLDISSLCDCAVAQLFENNYQLGVAELKLSHPEQVAHGVWASERNAFLRALRYERLTAAWKLQIERRRRADNDNAANADQVELPLAA